MSDDFDDFDAAMEDYLAMTPEQQRAEDARLDAELDNLVRERNRWLATLTVRERVAVHRKNWLRVMLENRRRIAEYADCPEVIAGVWRQGIRKGQIYLLKLREWRRTGVYPGEG